MKKVIFTALAAVFMLCSGFVNDGISKEEDPNCYRSTTVSYIDAEGEIHSYTRFSSGYALDEASCNRMAANSAVSLNTSINRTIGTVFFSKF